MSDVGDKPDMVYHPDHGWYDFNIDPQTGKRWPSRWDRDETLYQRSRMEATAARWKNYVPPTPEQREMENKQLFEGSRKHRTDGLLVTPDDKAIKWWEKENLTDLQRYIRAYENRRFDLIGAMDKDMPWLRGVLDKWREEKGLKKSKVKSCNIS